MALATRCPACSTIFRISTAQAAAKGGMVRCGHCSNVFNSLDALVRVEDLDVVEEIVVEAPAPAMPLVDDGDAAPTTTASIPPFPHSEISSVLASLSASSEAREPRNDAWWLPDPNSTRGPSTTTPLAAGLPASETSSRPSIVARDSGLPLALDADALSPWDRPESGTGPVFMQSPAPVAPPTRAAHWTWGTLALLALLLLLAQFAYLLRDEIAVRWSPAKPWLIAACAAVGCKVDYPAHVESITIESASIQTSAADANLYVLTALLRNRDAIDVRYPYIELLLTDLQDKVVVRRVLRPEDYLTVARDGSGLASLGFAAQSELPIRLDFELDGLRFTGYRLDKFYP